MKLRGQVDLWANAATAAITAAVLGAGAFIWGQIKPEPKEDQARAVAQALQAREMVDLRRMVDHHESDLTIIKPQLQRIEDLVTDIRDQGRPPKPPKHQGP